MSLDDHRIFVTGGSGFIGGHVVDALVARGARLTALHRRRSDTAHLRAVGADLVLGDVTRPDTLDFSGHDTVVHLAAWVGFGLPRRLRKRMWEVNVEGTRHVLEAARRDGVARVVHVSSIAALGDTRGEVAAEDFPRAPWFKSHYEETKWRSHALAQYAEGLEVAIPMPGVVLGPGGPLEMLVPWFAKGRIPLSVRGDAPTGYVHVRDVADGVARCVDAGEGPYLLVDENLTTDELFAGLAEVTGRAAPRRRVGLGALRAGAGVVEALWRLVGREPPVAREHVGGLATAMAYDAGRARKELGWRPDMWARLREDYEAWRDG